MKKLSLQSWQRQFISDLLNKFPGSQVVTARSDKQSGWDDNAGHIGEFTTMQKVKDDRHGLIARINNFANSLRAAGYRDNNRYPLENHPITMANFHEFQW